MITIRKTNSHTQIRDKTTFKLTQNLFQEVANLIKQILVASIYVRHKLRVELDKCTKRYIIFEDNQPESEQGDKRKHNEERMFGRN